jgi:carboxyl-terminal processing protease
MFLQPSQNKLTNEDLSGNFSGVGIELGYKDQQLAVVSPLSGSPAEKAGVKPGDLIVGIKDDAKKLDITTENINLNEAVEHIRGPVSTKVTLTLLREGTQKPIVVELIREKINVPSVKVEYLGEKKDILHVSILKFGGETLGEWKNVVNQAVSKNTTKKIILDLRNNPGGYLQDAVDISSEFLTRGSTVVIQQNGDGTKHELKTDRTGSFLDSEVILLVNGGSASASEILAGSLRDNRKIKLVGEKTFGKGTIQEPQELDGGAGLHVTIAKWLTPNGTWVHGEGLKPDVEIKRSEDLKVDNQLDEALKLIQQ